MSDERLLILQMLEKGKITADEAAALLDALQDQAAPVSDSAQPEPASDEQTATEGSEESSGKETAYNTQTYIEKARTQVEEGARRIRETVRQKKESGEIDAIVKTVQKGISQVIEEIPDVMNRLLRLDFRVGTGKVFEKSFAVTPTPGTPVTIKVRNGDGPIAVEASDSPALQVKVKNRVRLEDDEKAQELSEAAILWKESDSGFELRVGDHPKVTSHVQLILPANLAGTVDLKSDDGSIAWQNVAVEQASLVTADGSVQVVNATIPTLNVETRDGSIALRRVAGEVVRASTADGSIRAQAVARQLHCETKDGSIRFEGSAKELRCTTKNGSIRAEMLADPRSAMPEGAKTKADEVSAPDVLEQDQQWDLVSGDGSIHVSVPTGDAYGYKMNLATKDGRISVNLPEVELLTAGPLRAGNYTGGTRDFEGKSIRTLLNVRTADGSVRVEGVQPEGEAER